MIGNAYLLSARRNSSQRGADVSYEYVPIKDIMMEKSLYRALTQLKYRSGDDETTISGLVNEMLKEYLHTYILSKTMGHMLMSKATVKVAVEGLTEEQIKNASVANAERYKEGAIIEHGRPSLAAYLELIRSFAKANRFDSEISKNPDNGSQVLILNFQMGEKFSQFLGNTYRILLEEFADIFRVELTGTTVYFEFKPKKEVIQTQN
jgi:hypothetical protein